MDWSENDKSLDPVKDLLELVDRIQAAVPPNPMYFFTSGTGISDDAAINFYKNIGGVRVVTRDNEVYERGEFIGYLYQMNTN